MTEYKRAPHVLGMIAEENLKERTSSSPAQHLGFWGRKVMRRLLGMAALVMMVPAVSHAGYTTVTEYDAMRRPEKVIAPDGSYVVYQYNLKGQQEYVRKYSQTDVLLQMARTLYTATGQKDKTYGPECFTYPSGTESLSNTGCDVTEYDYDALDRVIAVTDGVGRITKTQYRPDGQVEKIIKAFGTALQQDYATYTYTENGKEASVMDANGNVTRYDYDGFDRLTHFRLPSTTTGSIASPNDPDDYGDYEQYAYDNNGNVTAKRTRRGDFIFSVYDNLGRVIRKITCNASYDTPASSLPANCTAAGGSVENDIDYIYDLTGLQEEVDFTAGGHNIHNNYDNARRLTSVVTTTGAVVRTLTYAYDDASNRTGIQWPDGFDVTYLYNNMNRVTAIVDEADKAIATYHYDDAGRRQSVVYGNGTVTSYGYHGDDALETLSHNLTDVYFDVDWTYGFNAVNQLTQKALGNAAYQYIGQDQTTGYTPNGLNQYASVGGTGYGYDDSGNLTSDGEWNYTYDVENMLLTASSVTASASYIYDPMGRRSAKTVDGTLTTFLHDGVEEVADYNAAGDLLRRYVHGPGVDEYIVMYEGTGTNNNRSYYHSNHQGSIVALSDDAGEMVEASAYTYSPYGMSGQEGVTGNPMRYTGRRLDAETGLYYYRARYYSPAIGRFLQTDPIGYGDGLNWYAYVRNDPFNGRDPSGLCMGEFCSTGNPQVDEMMRNARQKSGKNSEFGKGVGDALIGYKLLVQEANGVLTGNEKTAARIYMIALALQVAKNSGGEAWELFKANLNLERVAGRTAVTSAVSYFMVRVARRSGVPGSAAALSALGFSAGQIGAAVNGVSRLADKLEGAGFDIANLNINALANSAALAAAGVSLDFNEETGTVSAQAKVSRTGSRIKTEVNVDICTFDEEGNCK